MKTMKKRITAFILAAYVVLLIRLMVFKDLPTIRIGQLMLNFAGTDTGHGPNFVPFKTIWPYLLGHNGWIIAGINLVGNIALLVPIGLLIPFVFRNMTWKKSFIVAVASGLIIEIMQTVLRVGIFDIDDVILNALGVMIGYWAILILAKWVREGKYKTIIITAIIVITASAGAVYAVYPHGQPVMNPGVGAGAEQNEESAVPQSGDLCGGTGGTGEIVSQGNHTITIKSGTGVVQVINLTDRTEIRSSSGTIAESDLKIGEHVTVVIVDENKTATTVLVCNNYCTYGNQKNGSR